MSEPTAPDLGPLQRSCSISDETALASLFAPTPYDQRFIAAIRRGVTGFYGKHVEKTQTAFYIISDGKSVTCLTLFKVTWEQYAAIAAEGGLHNGVWLTSSLNAAVDEALDGKIRVEH